MSFVNPATDRTLMFIDDLQEEARRRFVKRRSKLELEEIVVAAWRERDEVIRRLTRKPRSRTQQVANLEPERTEDLIYDYEGDSNTAKVQRRLHPKIKRGLIDDPDFEALVDVEETSPHDRGSKRQQLDSDQAGPLELDVRRETFEATERKKKKKQRVEDLPMVLRVPNAQGVIHYASIDKLPLAVHARLTRLFELYRTTSESKRVTLLRIVNNPRAFVARPFCICDQLARCGSLKRSGKDIPPQKFLCGGVFQESADDKCVRGRIPCIHLMAHHGQYVLCLVPLPPVARKGKIWTELEFWVQA